MLCLYSFVIAVIAMTANAWTNYTNSSVPSCASHVYSGAFWNIYDPSLGENETWYINDHTFHQDQGGTWHLIGITHPMPADPLHETELAHATAPSLFGNWTKQAMALTANESYGETVLWAPYVFFHEDLYYMVYCGGGQNLSNYAINLATSADMFTWTRSPAGPLFHDGYQARDPFIMWNDNQWVMYYCGTDPATGGHDVVMYRTSNDLYNWSERGFAFYSPTVMKGVTESPYVYEHNGLWYLFIGPRPSQDVYVGTDVFVSQDPYHFDITQRVGHIHAHALEVVPLENGMEFVSHCGDGQGGVWIAPLLWS